MAGASEGSASHAPVLHREAVQAWFTDPNGLYIDGTFGRGGHSELLLSLLNEGKLLAMDRDPLAVACANGMAGSYPNMSVCHRSFEEMHQLVADMGWMGRVNGILVDLGVSSPQLDNAERGFSFMRDGPLDMRMDPSQGESAAEWLSRADHGEIAFALKRYGEERFAGRIASAIVEARKEEPIATTARLVAIIESAVPKKEQGKHKATRSFQGIRIAVNRELEQLEKLLADSLEILAPGGRLVVISFHSLEDRLVKRFMRKHARGERLPRHLPISDSDITRRLRLVGKAVKPGDAEIAGNPRSRSAILRVAEKNQ